MAIVVNTTLKADTKDAVKQVEVLKKEVERIKPNKIFFFLEPILDKINIANLLFSKLFWKPKPRINPPNKRKIIGLA